MNDNLRLIENTYFSENVQHFFIECCKNEKKVKFEFDKTEIYKVNYQNNDIDNFDKQQRRLLWHVTRVNNINSIGKEGITVKTNIYN